MYRRTPFKYIKAQINRKQETSWIAHYGTPGIGDTAKNSKDRVPFSISTLGDTNKKIIGACSATAKHYTWKKYNGQFSLHVEGRVSHTKRGKDKSPREQQAETITRSSD